ncbi:metallophosphoesterase family protein [Sphingomonas aliaeris]|uniref:Metallophosphoesterase family protein n=1 Tax=Sphingomonas aliaeris TaxID=2759526 RepID=A0A974NU79_9SPHN|nr:metallophosphoesterase [Sphingomonas aliaeris]QQV77071.1 metallophosphoesterase family protein [Sphingomonas aliaeris]
MRTVAKILARFAAIGVFVAVYGVLEARRDPIVRRIALPLADLPAGARPVRAVLISDVHLGNIAMGPRRLARIVDQINAVRPDIVLIAGDFIAGHEPSDATRSVADLAAGLVRLRAPLGMVAVLGNHDYGTDMHAVRKALRRADVTVLMNDAVSRGPLSIGGIDDSIHGHQDVGATIRAMTRLRGARVMMAHDPEIAGVMRRPFLARMLPDDAPRVILSGHTHCGQVAIPGLGPVLSLIGPRTPFLCGASRESPDRVVVTAGLGASILPVRVAKPPDLWVITFGPAGMRGAMQ